MTAPNTEFSLTPEEEAALGDPGKAAIDRMKAAQKDAQTEAARLRAQVAELTKPAPTVEPPAAPKDGPVDVAALIKAESDKIRTESLHEKASDKLEARAAKLLADPADAARYLKVADFVTNGAVDLAAMDAALSDLVKSKPYLKSGDVKPVFEGSADSGPKGAPGKEQITRAEVDRLYLQGASGAKQIEAYRLAGQLDNVLGIKH